MTEKAKMGLILGRFQPFHNEHLEYALAAKERCHFLWVGLTNFLPSLAGSGGGSGHRLRLDSNPLDFCERYLLVAESLREAGVKAEEFGIVPCPIEDAERLPDIVSPETRCFLTINEEWGREKADALEAAGYEVDVLWERDKTMSGSGIRESIRAGRPGWEKDLPAAVVRRLVEWGFRERLLAR